MIQEFKRHLRLVNLFMKFGYIVLSIFSAFCWSLAADFNTVSSNMLSSPMLDKHLQKVKKFQSILLRKTILRFLKK